MEEITMKKLIFAALAPLAVLAACAQPQVSASTAAVTDTFIDMEPTLSFSPSPVTISAGETVTFRNTSAFGHTVSTEPNSPAESANTELPAGAMSFDSGNVAAGGTYTHTFTVPGTYRYFCDPHNGAGMTGTIVVTAG